ncbi:MAG: FMN-binding protein [Sphaerochaeta sp.]|nr:MAG: FMN-binding protein [Sphaerochaeta sp.]
MSEFYKERIYPLLFMFITTVVCIVLTAGAHILTFDLAKANELSFTRRAILDAAGLSYENTTLGIEGVYLASVTEKEGYYTAIVDGKTRYIIPLIGPGLWGTIEIMAGLEEDLTTFSGVAIVNQSETPGLGGRIEEPWFTAQFAGKQGPFTLVEEGTAAQAHEVDGITGASRTSEYFKNLTDRAASEARRIIQGV